MDKKTETTQKITPFLWFDNNAEEAITFYTSVFKNSGINKIVRNGDAGPGPKGTVLTASFHLNGQDFAVINGGPNFKFTEAISFVVNCDTQAEIDYYWEKLSEGGEEGRCGWLKDKFGLSWQIVPRNMGDLMGSSEPGKAKRVIEALFKMNRLDITTLTEA